MAYVKKTWVGSADPLVGDPGSTSISEDALNHLETQYDEAVAFTTSAVSTKLNTADAPELIRDTMGSTLAEGTDISITVDDAGNIITISYTGEGGGAVDSVNGQTGVVVLDAGDVGALDESVTLDDIPTGVTNVPFTATNATKLSGIQAGAEVNAVDTVAGRTGEVTLFASDVGLSNVNNTSDADKPISDDTQAALDLKANAADLSAKENVFTAGANITIDRTNPATPIISASGGGGGAGDWGSIGGTLSDQIDLQSALDAKQNVITDSDDITQGTTNLFLTGAERTKLGGIQAGAEVNTVDSVNGQTGVVSLDIPDPADFATAAQGAKADSAVQPAALSGYVPTARTINGQPLSGDVTLDAADIGALPDDAAVWPNGTSGVPLSATVGESMIVVDTATVLQGSAQALVVSPARASVIAGADTGWQANKVESVGTLTEFVDDTISSTTTVADGKVYSVDVQFEQGVTVPDGSFAIAKTTGLQAALDGKQATITDSDDIAEGTTNLFMSSAQDTKLAGIATGATVNSPDATLLNRANHTGTQAAATISDFGTTVAALIATKADFVIVVTGDEDRPVDAGDFCIWLDTREGEVSAPANMGVSDIRFRPGSVTPGDTAPTIVTTTLNTMTVDVPFAQAILASGTALFDWSLASGSWPAGITFTDGVVSGTPTTATTGSVTVQADNSVGSDTQVLSWTVTETADPPVITTTSLGTLTEGAPFDLTLAATGDIPMTWDVSAGTIPSGLTLETTGQLHGTPDTPGAYSFTARATNAAGNDTQAYSGTVNAAPTGPYVNKTIDQNVRDGSTTHAIAFTPATAGNFLMMVVYGAVTFATPAGWTLRTSQVNNGGLYVFTKTATASESSVNLTAGAANYASVATVWEFPAGTTWVNAVGAVGQTATAANTNLTGLTGTNFVLGIKAGAFGSGRTYTGTAWTGTGTPVEDVDVSDMFSTTDGYAFSAAYVDGYTGAAWQPTGTVTFTGSGVDFEVITLAVHKP